MTDKKSAGERIAKVLARRGVASRREAERMIEAGRVSVNGRLIESPAISRDDQVKALTAVAEKAGAAGLTTKFLGLLADKRRAFALPAVIDAYGSMLAEEKGEVQAEVVSAIALTEEQAKEQGLETRTGQFPFAASGRAMSLMETDGFVKIVADAKTDEVLGVHMVGPEVTELIAEAALAIEMGATVEDIARLRRINNSVIPQPRR